jgi:hypothetical protein
MTGLFARWRARRACFHHDRSTGESWLFCQLIDLGRRKEFWCTKCGKMWIR